MLYVKDHLNSFLLSLKLVLLCTWGGICCVALCVGFGRARSCALAALALARNIL